MHDGKFMLERMDQMFVRFYHRFCHDFFGTAHDNGKADIWNLIYEEAENISYNYELICKLVNKYNNEYIGEHGFHLFDVDKFIPLIAPTKIEFLDILEWCEYCLENRVERKIPNKWGKPHGSSGINNNLNTLKTGISVHKYLLGHLDKLLLSDIDIKSINTLYLDVQVFIYN